MKNIVKTIDEYSPAEGLILQGDEILEINGKKIIDVLDYKFYSYDEELDILIKREEKEISVHLSKEEGEDLGLNFESYLMDNARSCANNCIFCFIDQLPKGMRKTMYFKDDDTRLSFLLGNYITLTNLSEREIQRIIDLHVSPVNVSVHTTNPELRCMMLRNKNAGAGIETMKRFAANGIEMNCQVVCCPGINDGEELMRTMRDLAELYPGVSSVSIVPVGLTKYREGLFELQPFTAEHAKETIELVEGFSGECLKKYGSRIFFCGDEFYIKAGLDIPDDEFYEDYPQLENGVGMLRQMETEFSSALGLSEDCGAQNFSIATGVSAVPLFEKLLNKAKEKYPALNGHVYGIINDFFGHSINVSGLITGRDLIAQLKGKELGDRLLISANMLRRDEGDFLDGITKRQAEEELGVTIIPTEQDGFDLLDAMQGLKEDTEAGIQITDYTEEEFYRYNE